jgi:hypothetical protein
MSLTLYDFTVTPYIRTIKQLIHCMTIAQKQNKVPESELVNARLVEDMYPFTFQIQRVSDAAKAAVARITGRELEALEDKETTMQQCIDRLNKTIQIIE